MNRLMNRICLGVLLAGTVLASGDAFAQWYNPYVTNPYAPGYYNGYGYGGYSGVQYYNYNAPYSHVYYSPSYNVQPRGYYTIPYSYSYGGGGYYGGGGHHGNKPSKPYVGGYNYSSKDRGEVPAGTVGWIPAPVSPRMQKLQRSGK